MYGAGASHPINYCVHNGVAYTMDAIPPIHDEGIDGIYGILPPVAHCYSTLTSTSPTPAGECVVIDDTGSKTMLTTGQCEPVHGEVTNRLLDHPTAENCVDYPIITLDGKKTLVDSGDPKPGLTSSGGGSVSIVGLPHLVGRRNVFDFGRREFRQSRPTHENDQADETRGHRE